MRNDIILAYEKDGQPLAEKLRLVVPGKWGYKWISRLAQIDLVDYNFLGRYESSGYSDEANIPGYTPSVGGLAGLPDIAQEPAGQSDWSGNRAAVAGAAAAAVVALTAGAWYARRRRLR
jgi:DMSO/TMAO reductase YedYZ molybdopterin-dependent catalytic subunit